ncbi:hypothetical protein C8Q73DRAFT_2834 [Cubamyces lactineus]|nr:hypothetical protein C8Q73DRAFT_2834 [Cubamyces lactineus]
MPTSVGSSPSLASPPPVPSLAPTYGAILIGTQLSLILCGVTLHQGYRYSKHYQADSAPLKSYVLALIISDTIQSALSIHTCYWFLISHHSDPSHLYTGLWSLNLLALLDSCIITACQSFYARQVYVLAHRSYRSLVVCVAAVMGTVALGMLASHQSLAVLWFMRSSTYRVFNRDCS